MGWLCQSATKGDEHEVQMSQMRGVAGYWLPLSSVRKMVSADHRNIGRRLYGREWVVSVTRKSMSRDDYDIPTA